MNQQGRLVEHTVGIHIQVAVEAGCVVLCREKVILQPLVSSPKAEVASVPQMR